MDVYRIQPMTCGEVEVEGTREENILAARFVSDKWSMSGAPHVVVPESQFHEMVKALWDADPASVVGLQLPLWAALMLNLPCSGDDSTNMKHGA